ncbi:MAG: rhodanese-like domain-containing protein [Lentimicrobium sp.]
MKEHFGNLGFEIDGILHLTGKQAMVCLEEGALLVDVREDFEIALKDFGVPGKLSCPFSDFKKLLVTLPKDKSLIVADCVGIHSKEAVVELMNNGFTRVANLAGGIFDWERDGLPMSGDFETLSGPCMCQIKSRKKNP